MWNKLPYDIRNFQNVEIFNSDLYHFQTGNGPVAYATVDTDYLILIPELLLLIQLLLYKVLLEE